MNQPTRWMLMIGMGALVTVVCLVQRQHVTTLRMELAEREQQRRELVALEQRNRQLINLEPSTQELARLQTSEDTKIQLLDDIARKQTLLREPAPVVPIQSGVPLAPVELPASQWKRAGFATPLSTVETALWAASSGEVDALARTLILDDQAKASAEQLLARMPSAATIEYGTAERLVALLATKELMTGAVQSRLSAEVDETAGEAAVRVRLRDATGTTQIANLTLQRHSDGWRVVVTGKAVGRLAAVLKTGTSTPH